MLVSCKVARFGVATFVRSVVCDMNIATQATWFDSELGKTNNSKIGIHNISA